MDCHIVKALPVHAYLLSRTMREADRAEVVASLGLSPLEALVHSLHASSEAKAFLVDCQVAALFGVAPDAGGAPGVASVWMLTSHLIDRHPLAFLRRCRAELQRLQEKWPVLFNLIDARHTVALRWVVWLGFEMGTPQPYGPQGLPFFPVQRRNPCAPSQPYPSSLPQPEPLPRL